MYDQSLILEMDPLIDQIEESEMRLLLLDEELAQKREELSQKNEELSQKVMSYLK